jgi:hypothetical protein
MLLEQISLEQMLLEQILPEQIFLKVFLKSNVTINVKRTNYFIVQNVRDNIIRTSVTKNMLLEEISLDQC